MAVNRLGRRSRARASIRLAGVATTAALLVGAVFSWSPLASASSISSDRQQISAIEAQIGRDGAYIEYLSNRYDQAQGRYEAVQGALAQAQAQLAAERDAEAQSRGRLRQAAIDAYMGGALPSALDGILQQSTISGLLTRTEFLDLTANNLEDAIQAYQRSERAVTAQEVVLRQEEATAAATLASLRQDEQAAQAAVQREQALLAQVKGNLQQALAAAYQQELAAQRAAAARQAALRAAELRASAMSDSVATVALPPSASWQQRAHIAVQTALAQVGKPYQWGAAGPNSFDCSGLVMYAWEAAGVYLPHYSGAQYADTTHVSGSDLLPGDIVFYNSPYDGSLGHEALYIGNGEVVQAPQSGMDVMVTSITWAGTPVAFGQPG
jgi:cell wall-associated NlpC family hydrolase